MSFGAHLLSPLIPKEVIYPAEQISDRAEVLKAGSAVRGWGRVPRLFCCPHQFGFNPKLAYTLITERLAPWPPKSNVQPESSKMSQSTIRYSTFPRTEPPPHFVPSIAGVLKKHENKIGTHRLGKGLTSNEVLTVIRDDLVVLGFEVEAGRQKADKIQRPVFFGENGQPTLKYEIDAYHPEWHCGLEVEAGRAWMGNAVYRDLVQGLVMVQVDVLVLAVPNAYKYQASGRATVSSDYDNTVNVAATLYGHSRIQLPYRLVVIGY